MLHINQNNEKPKSKLDYIKMTLDNLNDDNLGEIFKMFEDQGYESFREQYSMTHLR